MEITIYELHNQECTLVLEDQGIWTGREDLAMITVRQPPGRPKLEGYIEIMHLEIMPKPLAFSFRLNPCLGLFP